MCIDSLNCYKAIYANISQEMGCNVSIQVSTKRSNVISLRKRNSSNIKPQMKHVVPIGTVLPSTIGLESILRQTHLREDMRKFCEESWDAVDSLLPDAIPMITGFGKLIHSSNALLSVSPQARHMAINCIDFWADVEDLSQIPVSTFKSFRVCEIIHTYIVPGSTRTIPLTRSLQDHLIHTVFGTDIERMDNENFFSEAVTQILDFLISEVYYICKHVSLAAIARDHTLMILKAMSNGLKPLSRSGKSYAQNIQFLTNIVANHQKLRAFKKYVEKRDNAALLTAYLELLELRQFLSSVQDKSLRQSRSETCCYMLVCMKINEYYDKYISLAARKRIYLPEGVKGDFLTKLTRNPTAIDAEALSMIEDSLMYSLIMTHVIDFERSKEYASVEGSSLSTKFSMKSFASSSKLSLLVRKKPSLSTEAVTDNPPPPAWQRALTAMRLCLLPSTLAMQTQAVAAPTDDGRLEGVDATAAAIQRQNLLEMKSLLGSGFDSTFSRFLDVYGDAHAMHFYQSVQRLEFSSANSAIDRKVECEQIFYRYISTTAPEMISLPENIRTKILKELVETPRFLFSEAADWVLNDLCDTHWMEFKSEIVARAGFNVAEVNVNNSLSITALIGKSERLPPQLKEEEEEDTDTEDVDDTGQVDVGGVASSTSPVPSAATARSELVIAANATKSPLPHSSDSNSSEPCPSHCPPHCPPQPLQHGPHTEASGLLQLELPCRGNEAHFGFGQSGESEARSPNKAERTTSSEVSVSSTHRHCLRRYAILPGELETASILASLNFSPSKVSMIRKVPSLQPSQQHLAHIKQEVISKHRVNFRVVLDDPTLCSIFKNFLEIENTPHTLKFVVEHEAYICIMQIGAMKAAAARLFHKYIDAHACFPLPLTQATRLAITENLCYTSSLVKLSMLFNVAAQEVLQYLEFRQFRIFMNSYFIEDLHMILNERSKLSCGAPVSCSFSVSGSEEDNVSGVGTPMDGLQQQRRFSLQSNTTADNNNSSASFVAGSPPVVGSLSSCIGIGLSSPLPLPLPHGPCPTNSCSIHSQGSVASMQSASSGLLEGRRLSHSHSPSHSQENGFASPTSVKPVHRGSICNKKIELNKLLSIDSLVDYQTTLRFFVDHCQTSYCQENILFWLDAEGFAALSNSLFMCRLAYRLYLKYIDVQSIFAVNISSSTREDIEKSLAHPHPLMFRKAQAEILLVLNSDCMPKFLASRHYAEMMVRLNCLQQPSLSGNSLDFFLLRHSPSSNCPQQHAHYSTAYAEQQEKSLTNSNEQQLGSGVHPSLSISLTVPHTSMAADLLRYMLGPVAAKAHQHNRDAKSHQPQQWNDAGQRRRGIYRTEYSRPVLLVGLGLRKAAAPRHQWSSLQMRQRKVKRPSGSLQVLSARRECAIEMESGPSAAANQLFLAHNQPKQSRLT